MTSASTEQALKEPWRSGRVGRRASAAILGRDISEDVLDVSAAAFPAGLTTG